MTYDMSAFKADPDTIQRRYYARTAGDYDAMRSGEEEHELALAFMGSVIERFGIRSVLDIGSGTGRVLAYLKSRHPGVAAKGIEPVAELREAAYRKGIAADELIEGDACETGLGPNSFDMVCAFGVLHHIRYPRKVIGEMARVARKAVFISDSNNFGQGNLFTRSVKRLLKGLGLWKLAVLIKTKGRGYHLSEGDGLYYPYSVFDDYKFLKEHCDVVHVFGTRPSGINPYTSASHAAMIGIKKGMG